MALSRLLVLLAALLALAACAPRARPAAPPLWAVRDGDTTIYLFGSIHALDGRQDWLRGRVADALGASDAVVLEIPPGAVERAAGVLDAAGGLPADQSLTDMLPAPDRARLHVALAHAGQPPDALDRFAPWRAALALSAHPLAQAGYSPAHGVEAVLTQAAARAGKPVAGLETAAFQYRRFAAIPMAEQLAMLHAALEEPDRPLAFMRASTAAWGRGDVAALDRMVAADMAASPPHVAALLVTSRSRRWAWRIEQRMARPGTLFVAVGLGHLVGPGSVIADLKARGVAVDRLQ